MEQKLFNYYSIDECSNEDSLYIELDRFVDSGALSYQLVDRWILKLIDIDLTDSEILLIVKVLDNLDVFPYIDYESDEDDTEDDYYEDSEYGN